MARVAILLALCNGAGHLRAQIDSYLAQDHADWTLLVSDDGSHDEGPEIVQGYARRLGPGRVRLIDGPRQGPGANFLHLLRAVPADCAYAAFSDQDDVWLAHKLSRALAVLEPASAGPALYCSRRLICDTSLSRRRLSAGLRRPPGFCNALVENIVAGNTAVMNRAAIDLLCAAIGEAPVVLHDWWAYQVVTGAGGRVMFDDKPGLLYRQHAQNLVGANDGAKALALRAQKVAQGRYKGWNDRNIAALTAAAPMLTAENRAKLDGFARARRAGLGQRMAGLWRLRLYRQSASGQIAFWMAALLGRV